MNTHDKSTFDCDVTLKLGKITLSPKFCFDDNIVGLFGASGTGKTSILHAFAGIITPTSGHIRVNGVTWFDKQANINLPIQDRLVGLVFQDGQLLPHKSVMDNLLFGYRHRDKSARRFHPDDIISLLKLGHLTKRLPAKLSGGEKQRVALGRALLYSPNLLLMDEPLSALDSEHKQEILPFFQDIKAMNIPMLYVSHDIQEIEFLTSSVYRVSRAC
ncbi:Fe(3+) ions import ATP-binding protein FbpC [Moraxella lacunata]|uniref:Fe(3+) ions import ATP-binding protein FbpC n=1 Tax=Moraxella lacunata TaxID=477 RepID=A0A378T501_MORLA|nr:ATP-binding cassette domain-containing protein [Moraxella lacunata]STZ55730.1 Fe(3+) ions import ATP-binding protein FbpC [Moraxella lacunata]